MNCLSIETNWRPTEFCINIIPVELKTELKSYLQQIRKEFEYEEGESDKINITLEHAWYGYYDGINTIDEYYEKGINSIKYIGPLFSNKAEILNVLTNKHNSKKIKIFIDEVEINFVPLLITRNFQEMIKPQLKQNELAVYYGGISWMEMTFELYIDESFEENKLRFNFTDCGKHGYILNSISYRGEEMEKDYDPHKVIYFDLNFTNRNKLMSKQIY